MKCFIKGDTIQVNRWEEGKQNDNEGGKWLVIFIINNFHWEGAVTKVVINI